ncbi:actin binding protein [Savitreella phatthalungensis]
MSALSIGADVQSAYDQIRRASDGNDTAWAVFSYDADAIKVQAQGDDLIELADEFSDGKIQYAFLRVKDPSSGLPKLVLVGYCGEGAARKSSFQQHFASIARQLQGYHVQITARSDEDVTPEAILRKVEDSSGAKYSGGSSRVGSAAPATAPKTTNSLVAQLKSRNTLAKTEPRLPSGAGTQAPKPANTATKPSTFAAKKADDWAPAAPKTSAPASTARSVDEPVKSSYQPIGTPDIAALRAQASQTVSSGPASKTTNERSGTNYEPAQVPETGSLKDRMIAFQQSSNASSPATSAPSSAKKTNPLASRFGASAAAAGTKPLSYSIPGSAGTSSSKAVGGLSKNFGSEGGKTPAQLWAERKARERGETIPDAQPVEAPVKATVYGSDGPVKDDDDDTPAPAPVPRAPAPARADEPDDEDDDEADESQPIKSVQQRLAATTITPRAPVPPPATEPVAPEERAQPPPPPMGTRPSAARPAQPEPEPESEPEPEPEPEAQEEEEPEPEATPAQPQNAFKAQLEKQLGGGASPATSRPSEPSRANTSTSVVGTAAGGQGKTARVVYDYEAQEDNELSLQDGALITHIEEVDEGWWQGRDSAGNEGLFPANYVELIEGEEASTPAPAPVATAAAGAAPAHAASSASAGQTAIAQYGYDAAEEGEISFAEGDTITHIEQLDEGWWQGRNSAGEEGLFPANYVELQ